jgi:hypothetical protein
MMGILILKYLLNIFIHLWSPKCVRVLNVLLILASNYLPEDLISNIIALNCRMIGKEAVLTL